MSIIKREINLSIHKNKDFIYIMCLFSIMLNFSLFVLDNTNKVESAPILTWICTTFALQASIHNLFFIDYYNGILEQIFIQSHSSRLVITCKILIHWILFGLPISFISLIVNIVILESNMQYSLIMCLSLLFYTLIIISISAAGYSLTISNNHLTSGISQILVLPIIMPTFIYFKFFVEYKFFDFGIISITLLVSVVLLIISIFTTHIALKFAIQEN
ncbi:heme exporter protein CcmB [Wolbachia endosymbiont of Pentidionis agamae]|uniref:heme exporter protein CcmB n=1 Tax=Wolbachia endosymbiont of Pentidionis agamae TaxID=3110435 RepID=UPI002FD67477